MTKTTVTIFGGSGFLGRYIVRLLAKYGFNIRVAVRDTEKASYLSTSGEIGQISIIPASICSMSDVRKAINNSDYVINCVGILFEKGNRSFENLHVNGPANIAKIAKEENIKKLIHISALGASANSPSSYAQSKARGEEEVLNAFPRAIILRPSVVFGPDDDFINRFANWARFSPLLPYFSQVVPHENGGGGTKFQPVYVLDIAKAVLKIFSDEMISKNIYELVGPHVYDMRQILIMIREYSERTPWICAFPFWLGHIQSLFLQFLPNPPLTPDQIKLLRLDNIATNTYSNLQDIEIIPTPMESILPTYLKRFRPYQQNKKIRS
jgi:NADH dehydrogenase